MLSLLEISFLSFWHGGEDVFEEQEKTNDHGQLRRAADRQTNQVVKSAVAGIPADDQTPRKSFAK